MEKAAAAIASAVREWESNGTNFGYDAEKGRIAGEFGHNCSLTRAISFTHPIREVSCERGVAYVSYLAAIAGMHGVHGERPEDHPTEFHDDHANAQLILVTDEPVVDAA